MNLKRDDRYATNQKIIRSNVWDNSVLVTLLDGHCGLVDKKLRNIVIEIFV